LNWKRVSLGGFVVAVLAMAGLIWRRALLAGDPFTVMLQAAAIGLMLWARVVFGRRSFHASASPTEGGLITRGPYRLIRHPIYAAVLLFLVAGVGSHPSVVSMLLLVAVAGGMVVRIAAEEHLIVERYPEYVGYAARTKRLIPFVY